MGTFRDLKVFKLAFSNAMAIYRKTGEFPDSEKFGLTSQINRSSRSVCVTIGEAYRKRVYPKHYLSKLTDADSENSETSIWMDFALACELIDIEFYNEINMKIEEVGKLIGHMIKYPEKYGVPIK